MKSLTVLSVAYPFAPVGPNAVGGAEQVLTAVDSAIVEAGHRSIVVACEQSQTRGELLGSGPCHETLSPDLCAFARREHRRKIDEALVRWPVDLIHMHGVDFYEYLPQTSLPVLVTLHLPISFYPERSLREVPDNVHLHCVSKLQQGACPPGVRLLDAIENGVNVTALTARHARRNFAVALGRICPEKGFHLAIEAAKRADVPLFIGGELFGYAAHAEYWRRDVLPNLGPKHRWLGPLDFKRKRRLLTAARCLLAPSLVAETGSLVALEALACGTPVIAFPNGALSEIVEHGKTGFLVRTVEEMAQGIRATSSIDAETCRRAARERFSIERTTRAYLDLYAQLTGKRDSVEERRVA